ncbi:hypothetical protein HDV05_000868 [Chytridiales sp. JEL 0842]|nr:hypothetical protein HDV05_000868 [Chytridiales sp. JEL 0842]
MSTNSNQLKPLKVLVIGTGEYTTGLTSSPNPSDKSLGVLGLVLFDLRSRDKVGWVGMCSTSSRKNERIRSHLREEIAGRYRGLDVGVELFPKEGEEEDNGNEGWKKAIRENLERGDGVAVFTPDDTHFEMALFAVRAGMNVLIAKPAVKTVREHQILIEEAEKHNVLVAVELHKRFDPIYADARERMRKLGDFSYFYAYMSQPKHQLHTFKGWAGVSSDISYYLNSHHIDLLTWTLPKETQPITVVASCGTGIARSDPYNLPATTEDTITLLVTFSTPHPTQPPTLSTAVFTSSWVAPKAEVHSQQRFTYLAREGEVRIDQAHRGYTLSTDSAGYQSLNPLFLRYEPDSRGFYAGQGTYGHKSIEMWVDACRDLKYAGGKREEWRGVLATLEETEVVTRILEGGRRSLDLGGAVVDLTKPF